MKRLHAGVFAAAVAGSVLAMAGCGSSSPAPGADLVTPDQAKAVALAHLQKPTTSAVAKDDVGSLRALDQATATVNPPKSPEPTQDPATTHVVTIWVAHQSSYPLTFACFDNPTVPQGRALPQLFVFTKANGSAPWAVSFEVVLGGMSTAPDVALDSGGYAQAIPRSRYGSFLVPPTQLANDYAAYLTAGNSADTHEFAPGSYTSAIVDNDNKNIRTVAQQKAETVTITGAPTGDPVVAYLLNDGSAVVVFGTRLTAHVVANKAPIAVTQDGKGIAGPAPGKYRDTTTETLLLVGFIDPAKGSADKVTGIGGFGGVIRSSGTPA